MKTMQINLEIDLTSNVIVELTEFGKKVWNHHWSLKTNPRGFLSDKENTIEYPLGMIMNIFGDYVMPGDEAPFTKIIIPIPIK